ncbi:hypothetical protein KUCAC02_016895 [Chaenocephalus aceratus]|nr:hypothetical protein KUCAC02_016895 [Chaenocephalus aceratus]
MRQHHLEKESNESGDKMNHNDVYLLNGWERKHLAFGSASIHALLTANPTRKYLPPSGKLDRRSMIVLVLLLAGDIHLNPGLVQTRSQSCRLEELASQLASQLASLPLQQQLRDDNREHGDSGDRGINGDFDIPPGTPRQTDTHEAVTRGREPRSEGTNIRHVVGHING